MFKSNHLKSNPYTWILVILVISFSAILKFQYHELWKDEWQAWFLSRDLGTLDLLGFLYYEGHPSLWYLFLKPFAWIFPQGDLGLKLAHMIMCAGVIILWFKSNLPLWLKIVIIFSYPVFFEYGVVSRGYILTILFSSCLFFLDKDKKWFPFILFALCQTEVQGVFIGFAFMVMWIYSSGFTAESKKSFAGYALGVLTFLMTVFPRGQKGDLQFAYSAQPGELGSWLTSFQGTTSNVFFMGFLPDTNVFGVSSYGIILGIISLILLCYLLREQRKSLMFFSVFWLCNFIFHGIIYNGGLRQWSMIFVVFSLSLFLIEQDFWKKKKSFLFFILILGPLYYSGLAVTKDMRMPFTNSKEVGEFIKENVPKNVPVVAINKFECTPVVGYAQRSFYSLPDGETFTYFKWVEKVYIPTESELDLFTKYKKVGGIIVIAPFKLDEERFPRLKEWKRFERKNLKGENYILYTHKLK